VREDLLVAVPSFQSLAAKSLAQTETQMMFNFVLAVSFPAVGLGQYPLVVDFGKHMSAQFLVKDCSEALYVPAVAAHPKTPKECSMFPAGAGLKAPMVQDPHPPCSPSTTNSPAATLLAAFLPSYVEA